MKDWLKGGLIGAGIGLILGLFENFDYFYNNFIASLNYFFLKSEIIFSKIFCSYTTETEVGFNCLDHSNLIIPMILLSLIVQILVYSLAGGLIGYIIGKIKSRT